MSKSNLRTNIIKMPLVKDYVSIVCKKEKTLTTGIIMTYITDEDEKTLDAHNNLSLKRGNTIFKIPPENVYCYGNIDLNRNTEDYDVISTFNWLDHLSIRGICVPSNYDYKTHTCKSNLRVPRWYDTTKPEVVTQYCHGLLNKPEKIVIFRYERK